MFDLAKSKQGIPYLASLQVQTALSVYTPVTNSGMSAMITGEYPNINGVHSHTEIQPLVA